MHAIGPDPQKAIEVTVINAGYIKEMHESALYLAKGGWTIPMEWTLSQIREARELKATVGNPKNLLVDWYAFNDFERLKELERRIASNPDFAEWKVILGESFKGFHLGLRTAIIPALITILEGVVARKVGTTGIHLKNPTAAMANDPAPSVLHQVVWLSLNAFVERLYEASDFKSQHAPVLNRHWILHGRDHRAWGDTECLKLFNFFGTLSSV